MSSTILLIATARVPGTPSQSTVCFQSLSCSCEAAGLPATIGTGRWSQVSLPNPGREGGGLWGPRLLSTVPLLPGAKLVTAPPSRMIRVSLTLCRPLSLSRSTPALWDGQSGSRSPPAWPRNTSPLDFLALEIRGQKALLAQERAGQVHLSKGAGKKHIRSSPITQLTSNLRQFCLWNH